MVFNQRSVAEILQMIRIVGALVGSRRARRGAGRDARERTSRRPRAGAQRCPAGRACSSRNGTHPLISGIRWVEELVEIAGGEPIFPELRDGEAGKDRIVDPAEVCGAAPDVIVASWCGKAVRKDASPRGQAGAASQPCATDTCTK